MCFVGLFYGLKCSTKAEPIQMFFWPSVIHRGTPKRNRSSCKTKWTKGWYQVCDPPSNLSSYWNLYYELIPMLQPCLLQFCGITLVSAAREWILKAMKLAFLCCQMVLTFFWLVPLITGQTQSWQLEMRRPWDCSDFPGHEGHVRSTGNLRTAEFKSKFLFHSYHSGMELFLYVSFKSCCHASPHIGNSVSDFPLSCSSGYRTRMAVIGAI